MAVFSRFEVIYEKLAQTSSLGELSELIREMRDAYGLAHLVYHAIYLPSAAEPNPIFLPTYESNWVRRYTERDYFRIDPIVANGRNSFLPLDWADVDQAAPEVSRFFKEASSYGVGRNGLTIPIRGPSGERALFSITSNESAKSWQASKLGYMRDFQFIAPFLHDQAVRLARLRLPDVKRQLSPRESETLQLTASGLSPKQIAADLELSPTAVRLYLQSARFKLECSTLSQAIAKAVSLEIIDG
jgi:DNA-binding CsgD family transcriptional regulator